MHSIEEIIAGHKRIGISGHTKPDGDCIGSCLAIYNYIRNNFPDIVIDVYLEPIAESFKILSGADDIIHDSKQDEIYDLFMALDCGDKQRLGLNLRCFQNAKHTVCIDHHVSNMGYADVNVIVPMASSTCELIYGMMPFDKIDKSIAEALYVGIVHDTGVFKHSCTTEKTMVIASKLMSKGVDCNHIIKSTYSERSYAQNRIIGHALEKSVLLLDGACVASMIDTDEMEKYGVCSKELDCIIDELTYTRGIECAIFMYQVSSNEFKVSIRSNDKVDVSEVALAFGGGGHKHAAGCTLEGTYQNIIENIISNIQEQLTC